MHRRGAVLRVMCLALMLVVAGVTSLNVALPSIGEDTGASQTQLQWIVDAYALVFAALLLPAGAIGDRFGRKPILVAGLTLYGVAASAALFLDSTNQLITVRALLGLAAAAIMPVTLSVITSIFPPEERGKAVGTWVGVAAAGGVAGLVISGLLLHWFSWHSIFLLNIVLAGVALTGTLLLVPASRESRPPRLDPVGTLLSAAGIGAIVFGTVASYWHFLGGLLPFGAGMALAGSPATTAIVASMPREKQGVASAVNDLSRELGGALGIAVLGSILNGLYRSGVAGYTAGLSAIDADKVKSSLTSAKEVGGADLVHHAESAYVHGVSVSLLAGAAILLSAVLFVGLRGPGRVRATDEEVDRARAATAPAAADYSP